MPFDVTSSEAAFVTLFLFREVALSIVARMKMSFTELSFGIGETQDNLMAVTVKVKELPECSNFELT